jgi:tetratricopeptide (TPR) repeat protein
MAALLFVTLVVAAGSNLREMRRTRIEAEHARAIQEFVEDLIAPVTRGLPGDQHPGLEELLERGVARVQHQAALAPAVRSKLLSMFSRAFQQAGRSHDAEALADEAWRFARFAWGTKDRRTLEAQAHRNLLACQHTDGRERCAGVEAVLHDMRERGMRGPEYGKLQLAHAFARYSRDGNSEAAMRRLREANAFLGPHASHENSNLLLARLHEGGGEHDDALVLYQKIHDEHVRRDGEDRASAYLLGNIAYVQCALGRWRDCNASLDRAVDQLGRIGVRDHPDRLFVYKYACFAAGLHGKPERAEALCNEAVAMAERLYGRQHRDYASALLARGRMRADRGQLAAARADLDNAQTTYSSLPAGARTRRPMNTWLDVARSVVQRVEGDYEGMRQSLSRVVRSGQLDDVGPFPEMLAQLALACAHAPDPDCPDDLVARVDRELAEPSRTHHTVRIRAQMALARLAMFRGDPARALQRLADAEATTLHPQIAFARDHPVIAEIRLLRGNALEVLGEHDEAMKEWHAAQAVFNRELPPDHPYCLKLASRLGTLLTQPPVTSH